MENEYLFINIESYYKEIVKDGASLTDKTVNTRKVIEIILKHYLKQTRLKEDFTSFYIHGRRALNNSHDMLFFLIKKKIIPQEFENNLHFIRKDANDVIHTASRKIIENFEMTHLPHINNFILWFYTIKGVDCNFIRSEYISTSKNLVNTENQKHSKNNFWENKYIAFILIMSIISLLIFWMLFPFKNQKNSNIQSIPFEKEIDTIELISDTIESAKKKISIQNGNYIEEVDGNVNMKY